MESVRIKLKISYIGTEFSGWQIQIGQRTVQGCLEECLKKICERDIRIHGAGRTDAGVHALGQVAHCDIPVKKKHIPWQKALNSLLPKDISIVETEFVAKDFHARLSAKAKIYSYTLWTEPKFIYPMRRPFCWQVGKIDVDKMLKAAKLLEGTRDFKCFQNKGTDVKNTVRTIFKIFCIPGIFPQEKKIYFIGDGFLKQMVRNIMGSLYRIGKGKMSIEEFKELIEQKDRTLLPMTAPAHGLCLEEILY